MRSVFGLLPLLALVVDAQRCGNEVVPSSVQAAARYFAKMDKLADARTIQSVAERSLVIDTYFHIISSDNTEANGNLPDDKVQAQLDALNRDYKGAGISFNLKETTRTVNKDWATFSVDNDSNDVEYTMKKALRKGSYAALNVYYRPLGDGLLGICVFPEHVTAGDRTFILDGCQVLSGSVPNGGVANYEDGKTATHEIGHWLGLFHTFQGGCATGADGGDGVSDTPAQKSPTNGCPNPNPDTCTGASFPGVDPIHNFMDYSYDVCMNEFTAGQTKRIFDFWDEYRAADAGQPGPDPSVTTTTTQATTTTKATTTKSTTKTTTTKFTTTPKPTTTKTTTTKTRTTTTPKATPTDWFCDYFPEWC
ncbi:Ulilysin [Dactylellina cionopaga]|nr:Ulilysin [Dactylellina cionopaga]